MRHLAVDLGTKRVGLAISDAGGTVAAPLAVLTVANPDDARRQVADAARREAAEVLVVGCPYDMDGAAGRQAREAAVWAAALGAEVGLPVVMVDERLSSFAAEQQLNARRRGGERLTRGGKKKRLDALAAAGFLGEYLDGTLTGGDPADVVPTSDNRPDGPRRGNPGFAG